MPRQTKTQNEADFHKLVTDGGLTPEGFVLKVMRGELGTKGAGNKGMTKMMRQRYEAAVALLPYRLPRLNSIDATTRNVEIPHEEWIKQMEGDE